MNDLANKNKVSLLNEYDINDSLKSCYNIYHFDDNLSKYVDEIIDKSENVLIDI